MNKVTPFFVGLVVDGTYLGDPDGDLGCADDPEFDHAPYYVFDADQQCNVAGPFYSRAEADKALADAS